ncbi:hypothetical protein AAFF_G00271280 [Aldrovandia affinis]|uniref:Uncharacterized protein n=1 Tax=Aldrovandia affinis TaxID=143900 RepID=A0AAD7RB01_9TELE|nr:hypothetical protein AAFF_G00271280 [Aldrovandia affinis]
MIIQSGEAVLWQSGLTAAESLTGCSVLGPCQQRNEWAAHLSCHFANSDVHIYFPVTVSNRASLKLNTQDVHMGRAANKAARVRPQARCARFGAVPKPEAPPFSPSLAFKTSASHTLAAL